MCEGDFIKTGCVGELEDKYFIILCALLFKRVKVYFQVCGTILCEWIEVEIG